jgi:hypothetical protein
MPVLSSNFVPAIVRSDAHRKSAFRAQEAHRSGGCDCPFLFEGVDLKKLRQIARAHIEKAASGDMQAIKELADRLDGRPAQTLEHSGPDSNPITRIVSEIVHVNLSPEELSALNEAALRNSQRSLCRLNGIERMEADGRMWIPEAIEFHERQRCNAAAEGAPRS